MPMNCCRTYRIVVTLEGQTAAESRRRRSLPSQCEEESLFGYDLSVSWRSTCYIAAEIESSLVGRSGYRLILGDGKDYGGFKNVEPADQVSSVTIGILWSYVSL